MNIRTVCSFSGYAAPASGLGTNGVLQDCSSLNYKKPDLTCLGREVSVDKQYPELVGKN